MPPDQAGTAPAPDQDPPRPLTAAVQGFVELATWWTSLVGENAATVARAVDEGNLDGDTAARALARGAALPLLGWVGLVNEVFDAAAVIDDPPQRRRRRRSELFFVDRAWAERELALGPLVNGSGEQLVGVPTIEIEEDAVPPERRAGDLLPIRLVVDRIPPECVGVYAGTVAPVDATESDGEPVPVWITVP